MSVEIPVRQLGVHETVAFRKLLHLFGRAFEDKTTYSNAQPSDAYLDDLLGSRTIIILAASEGDEIIGGLVAYELQKFEQECSEIYVYDLAVDDAHRRKRVATTLIEHLRTIAADRGAYTIFIQADREDAPAIALYTKLGTREEVVHFDIPV